MSYIRCGRPSQIPGTIPPSYILQQTGIGWRHIYLGHIVTAWSALQIPDGQTTDTSKARYMWAASIVEVSLWWMIDLWEARNKDVHGHTKTEQNSRLKVKHQEIFRNMLAKKIQMRLCNHWLFHRSLDWAGNSYFTYSIPVSIYFYDFFGGELFF